MVLIADLVGDDADAVARTRLRSGPAGQSAVGGGFIAVSPEARRRFWLDRARTAAIAAHTNAFKINEDVVIPLERLAEYSEGIERINIEQSIGTNSDHGGCRQRLSDGRVCRSCSNRETEFEDSAEEYRPFMGQAGSGTAGLQQGPPMTAGSTLLDQFWMLPATAHSHLLRQKEISQAHSERQPVGSDAAPGSAPSPTASESRFA